MLILIFFNVQYLQNVFLILKTGLNHSMVTITLRHIRTGKYKIPPLQQNFLFPHWGGIPSYPLMTHSIQISRKQDGHNIYVTMKKKISSQQFISQSIN